MPNPSKPKSVKQTKGQPRPVKYPQSSVAPESAGPYAPRHDDPSSYPTAESAQDGTASQTDGDQKSGKRKCVSTACIPCRKRKSKCDGSMPRCSTCIAVYRTECSYDADINIRRKLPKREEGSEPSAVDESDAARVILAHLRSCPNNETLEVLSHIRNVDNLEIVAEELRKSGAATRRHHEGSSGDERERPPTGQRQFKVGGQTRFYGLTSALSLLPAEDTMLAEHIRGNPAATYDKAEGWTKVCSDTALVRHFIRLYFAWQHPFYHVLDENKFWEDFDRGQTNHCSSLLVNAICSFGCQNSDLPLARTEPNDCRTAGDHYFAEARRLLYEHETSCLPTAQALQIMSMREASSNRDSGGFQYAGRSLRMATELGLHLASSEGGMSEDEIRVRRHTFWGLFTCETAWSNCIGRATGIATNAVDVHKLPGPKNETDTTWTAYTDDDFLQKKTPSKSRPFKFAQYHNTLWAFSEIVSDAVNMFYAPRERVKAWIVRDMYTKYLNWYKSLPDSLQITDQSPPQIYDLHLYYHVCIYHLFSFYAYFKLQNIKGVELNAHKLCVEHCHAIASIMRRYREHFDLRRCNLLSPHIALSMCVYLTAFCLPNRGQTELTQENIDAQRAVVDGLRDLSTMASCHNFAARCFKVVVGRAEEYKKQIPAAAFEFLALSPTLSSDARLRQNVQSLSLPSPARAYPVASMGHVMNGHDANATSRPYTPGLHGTPSLSNGNSQYDSPRSAYLPAPQYNGHNMPSRPLSRLATSQDQTYPSNFYAPPTTDSSYAMPYMPAPSAQASFSFEKPLFTTFAGQGLPLIHNNQSHTSLDQILVDDKPAEMARNGFFFNTEAFGHISGYGRMPGQDVGQPTVAAQGYGAPPQTHQHQYQHQHQHQHTQSPHHQENAHNHEQTHPYPSHSPASGPQNGYGGYHHQGMPASAGVEGRDSYY